MNHDSIYIRPNRIERVIERVPSDGVYTDVHSSEIHDEELPGHEEELLGCSCCD